MNNTPVPPPSKLTALYNAVLPFAKIVEDSSGRIPTERLSAADWHALAKAFRSCDTVEAPTIRNES